MKSVGKLPLFLFGIACVYAAPVPAADWGRVRAYAKTYAIGGYSVPLREGYFQSLSAFRLMPELTPTEWLNFEVAYEAQPVFQFGFVRNAGGAGSSLPRAASSPYRWVDFTAVAADTAAREFVLFHNLDRVNFRFKLPFADLTLGRQAITFGSANTLSATDVLLPFAFQQLNVEYRIGVDALRIQVPIAQFAEIDLGAVLGEGARLAESAAFVRGTFSLLESQWTLTGIYFSQAWLAGFGLERSLGPLGWNTDLAYTFAPEGERSYLRLTTGVTYQFSNGLVLTADYHHSGAGAANAGEYLGFSTSFAARRGGVFLAGRHYLISGFSYPAHALVSLRGQLIGALQDPSVFLTPSVEWNVFDNAFLDAGLFLPAGEGNLRSEFGLYPLTAFTAFRYYF
jgi:hypothetical protein